MKKVACFLLFTFMAYPIIHAQTYLSISEKIINADFSVFQPMATRGFSDMNEGIVQIRSGVKVNKNKWAFNSHIAYFLSRDQNRKEDKKANFYGYGFSLGAQYQLGHWKAFKVRPTLEIGLRKYHLDYIEAISNTPPGTFRPIKEDITVFSFDGIGMYTDIGFGLEKFYALKHRAFGIGFEAGYRLDYGTWELSDPIPINNANASHNGLFLNINILVALKRSHR